MVSAGQSLLELAVLQGVNPWTLIAANGLEGSWSGLPGDVLVLPGDSEPGPGALPPSLQSASLGPLPLVQGKTAVIKVAAEAGVTLRGKWAGVDLQFFPGEDGNLVAMLGVYARQEPGVYPLMIEGTLPDGTSFRFFTKIAVLDGNYPFDPTLYVDPATIDPEVTRPENAQWAGLVSVFTPKSIGRASSAFRWMPLLQNAFPLVMEAGALTMMVLTISSIPGWTSVGRWGSLSTRLRRVW